MKKILSEPNLVQAIRYNNERSRSKNEKNKISSEHSKSGMSSYNLSIFKLSVGVILEKNIVGPQIAMHNYIEVFNVCYVLMNCLSSAFFTQIFHFVNYLRIKITICPSVHETDQNVPHVRVHDSIGKTNNRQSESCEVLCLKGINSFT